MRTAFVVLAFAASCVVAGCGGGEGEGRLGAMPPEASQLSATDEDRAGGPVPVLETTTTAPIVAPTTAPPAGGQADKMTAMVDCLRRNGINVPEPKMGADGVPAFDEAALSEIGRDPRASEIAQKCSTQI